MTTFAGTAITYAKAGEAPADRGDLHVFDLSTGAEVKDVSEVNAAEGWLIRAKRNAEGELFLDGDEVARERIVGRFEIRRAI
jgi:hypothetical protein